MKLLTLVSCLLPALNLVQAFYYPWSNEDIAPSPTALDTQCLPGQDGRCLAHPAQNLHRRQTSLSPPAPSSTGDSGRGSIGVGVGNISAGTGDISAGVGNINITVGNVTVAIGNIDVEDIHIGDISVIVSVNLATNAPTATNAQIASAATTAPGTTLAPSGVSTPSTTSTGSASAITAQALKHRQVDSSVVDSVLGDIESAIAAVTGVVEDVSGVVDSLGNTVDTALAELPNISAGIAGVGVKLGNVGAAVGNITLTVGNINVSLGDVTIRNITIGNILVFVKLGLDNSILNLLNNATNALGGVLGGLAL